MYKKNRYITAAALMLVGTVVIFSGLSLLLNKVLHDETAPPDNAAVSQKSIENSEDPEPSDPETPNNEVFKDMLYGTYEYVDEYRSGHPVTYTFYADGRLLVYYWESEEDEDVPIGSTSAVYTVNDAMDEITITWDDDGSTEVKAFDLGRRKITLGKSELKKIKKDIYEN